METLTVTGIEVDERKPAQLITTVNSKEGRLLPTQVSYGRLLMENPHFCVKFSLYPKPPVVNISVRKSYFFPRSSPTKMILFFLS
jgi:hypothetical protein